MGGDLRWDFRRKDTDDDSSSDESKSSSEVAHEKHKLVSSLISDENDEENGTHRVEQNVESNSHTEVETMSGKGKKVHFQKSGKKSSIHGGTERDSHEEGSRKKSKTSFFDPAAMDEVEKFRESLIEDLRVTRENLFHWMRQELQKLVANDTLPPLEGREGSLGGKILPVQHRQYTENTTPEQNKQVNNRGKFEESILVHDQNNSSKNVMVPHETKLQDNVFSRHHNNLKETIQVQQQEKFQETDVQVQCRSNFESGMRAQKCNIGSLKSIARSNQAIGYDNGYRVLGERADNGQAARSMIPTGKFGSFVKPNFQFCSTEFNVHMQHQTNFLLGMRPESYNSRSLESPWKGKERAKSNNCQPWTEHQVDCVRDIASSEIDRGARLTVPNAASFSSNVSSQVASSMYLTSPSVLPRPYGENQILGTSSYSYIQPTVAGNKLGMNFEKANTMLKVNSHYGNFTGTSHQGRNGSIAHIGSRNVSFVDRQSILTPSVGTGFTVSPHQCMDFGASFPSQASIKYLPRVEKNLRDLRMNEGAKMFCGGSYAVPGDYISNNLLSRSISKPQRTLQAFQRENLEQDIAHAIGTTTKHNDQSRHDSVEDFNAITYNCKVF